MPIDLEVINHPVNRCSFFNKNEKVRDVLSTTAKRLDEPGDFHILFELELEKWAALPLERLVLSLEHSPSLAHQPLRNLDFYQIPIHKENSQVDLSHVMSLSRSSPGHIVIITQDNKPIGIINNTDNSRSGSISFAKFKTFLRSFSLSPESTNAPNTIQRFTDISYPEKVLLNTTRFHLIVRLLTQPNADSNHTEALELNPNIDVTVSIFSKYFYKLSSSTQAITLIPQQDSAPIVFDLKPTQLGNFPITITFFQERHPLGVATIPVEVVRDLSKASPVKLEPLPIKFDTNFPSPKKVIEIHWDRGANTLIFSLQEQGHIYPIRFKPVQLHTPPEIFVKKLFETLTNYERDHKDDRSHQLKRCGQSLWKTLIPNEFKTYYQQNRTAWRNQAVLIYSDEPYFPWEILQPWGDNWEDDEPWCINLNLARWLRRGEQELGYPVPQGTLQINSLAHIAPSYIDHLTQSERDYLKNLIEKWELLDASPEECNWQGIMDLFEKGQPNWVHLTAHGSFRAKATDLDSGIHLDGPDHFHPFHLTGPEILNQFKTQRPSFVFNSCHVGRIGFNLNGLGGWASQLIGNHASLFLAPLWAVRSKSALKLVQSFYNHLFEGLTAAEALRKARIEARKAGNTSWLAYSLYAHPNARLIFEKNEHLPQLSVSTI